MKFPLQNGKILFPKASVKVAQNDTMIAVKNSVWHYENDPDDLKKGAITISAIVSLTALFFLSIYLGVAFQSLLVSLACTALVIVLSIKAESTFDLSFSNGIEPFGEIEVISKFRNDGTITFSENTALEYKINVHEIRSIELGKIEDDTDLINRYAQNPDEKPSEYKANLKIIRVVNKHGISRVVQTFCYKPDQADPIITALKDAYEATLKAAPLPRNV